ncbi:TetR/AcrR family transcriptional regulator [Kineococcus arenarius]|uniref:TetR/AcrR family transcriptional regulator n=1 Tax=unclassified Kineococcus TaxID=2621656 RepID=UPI003D7F0CA0
MPRAGRRKGAPDTRSTILEAARTLFAQYGFEGTTIRAIAASAGVTQGLVHHYFGTKEGVFVKAVHLPVDPDALLAPVLDAPAEEVGERLARAIIGIWDDPRTRTPLLALLRSATSNEQAARLLRSLLETVVFRRIGDAAGAEPVQVSIAAGQAVGVMLLRYVVRVEPLAQAGVEELVGVLAPMLQATLVDAGRSET